MFTNRLDKKLECMWVELSNLIRKNKEDNVKEIEDLKSRISKLESVHRAPTLREYLLQNVPDFLPRTANFRESTVIYSATVQISTEGINDVNSLNKALWSTLVSRTSDSKLRDLVGLEWSRDICSMSYDVRHYYLLYGYEKEEN